MNTSEFLLILNLITIMLCVVVPYVTLEEPCAKSGKCRNCPEADNSSFVVVCLNAGLSEVPGELPTNMTALSLFKNKIEFLQDEIFHHHPELGTLLLASNKIQHLPENVFSKLTNLQRLYLHENNLTSIPEHVFNSLDNLEVLTLGDNKLSEISECTFDNLHGLKSLDLRNNRLMNLPNEVFLPLKKLIKLDLSGNKLHILSENVFLDLNNLSHLNLQNNSLTYLKPNTFNTLERLKYLHLDHNQLGNLPNHIFKSLSYLRELVLNNNDISSITEDFRFPKNLNYVYMQNNKFENLPEKLFDGMNHVRTLFLDGNRLTNFKASIVENQPRLVQITFSNNKLRKIDPILFYPLEQLFEIDLSQNNINEIPLMMFPHNSSRQLKQISLSANQISSLSREMFRGLNEIHWLYLSRNKISFLKSDVFRDFYLTGTLDLSSNLLTSIPEKLFYKENNSHKLEVLLLQRNQIQVISKGAFDDLLNIKLICLFYNKINTLADNSFVGGSIENIYLFGNNLTNLRNRSFSGKNISQIHLYGNNLFHIDEYALSKTTTNSTTISTLYLSCDKINDMVTRSKTLIQCVTPKFVPIIVVDYNVVNYFRREGFVCNSIDNLQYNCTACQKGTYGNGQDGCTPCPRGGYYQNDIGVTPTFPNEMCCKLCTDGTYVNRSGATSAEDCKVCPDGTNKTIHAGFRACPCLDGYARKDRFGPCERCDEDGVNCTQQDFRTIQPGYFWSWNFTNADLVTYRKFVHNLQKRKPPFDGYTSYLLNIPKAHKCPRADNCENTDDVIEGSCAKGYKGWLCTKCEQNFYSVMNTCFPCPSKFVSVLETGLIVIAFVGIYLIILWRFKGQKKLNGRKRSIIDIFISRGKIVLGFYQVVGEFFKSLHDITWGGDLYIIGEFISYIELNVLRIFVRPQCINETLIINPKTEFIIAVSFPVATVVMATVMYHLDKIYLKCRKNKRFDLQEIRSSPSDKNSKTVTYVIILLYVTYTPICTSVFQLYPKSCTKFCLDTQSSHCIYRLRSDYDINCTELTVYQYAAYVATIGYVVGFPMFLLYLMRKYNWCALPDVSRLPSLREQRHLLTDNEEYGIQPAWWLFLCESYKPTYWYWEIIELTRKVTQTVLITLLGWEHKLTVLLTIAISVTFLTLHARFMPMKNNFEQGLQMFSLTAILINVLVAGIDFSSEYDTVISTALIFLNVVVVIIIAVDVVLYIVMHLRGTSINCSSGDEDSSRQIERES